MTQATNQYLAATAWIVLILAASVAALIDVRCRRIPNKLSFNLLLAGLIASALAGGWGSLGQSLLAALIAGAPFIALFVVGGGGAGDAKMMLAVGAWLSPWHAMIAVLAVAIAGGLLSLVYAKAHQRLLMALANTAWMFLTLPFIVAGPGRLQERQRLMPASADGPLKTPYSLAILGGVLTASIWIWIHAR